MTLSTVIFPDESAIGAGDLLTEEAQVLAGDANRASFDAVRRKQQVFYTEQVRARAQAINSRDDLMSEDLQQKTQVLRALENEAGEITPIHVAIPAGTQTQHESVSVAKDKVINHYQVFAQRLQQINAPEMQQQYIALVAAYSLLEKQLAMAKKQKDLFAYNAAYLALKQFTLSESFLTLHAYFLNLSHLHDDFFNNYLAGTRDLQALKAKVYKRAENRVIKAENPEVYGPVKSRATKAKNEVSDEVVLSPDEKRQQQERDDALLAAKAPVDKLDLAMRKTQGELKKYSGVAAKSDEAVRLRAHFKALEDKIRPLAAAYNQLEQVNRDLKASAKTKRLEAKFLTSEKAELADISARIDTFKREVIAGVSQFTIAGITLVDQQAMSHFVDDLTSFSSGIVKETYHFDSVKKVIEKKRFIEKVAELSNRAVEFIQERVIDPASYLDQQANDLNEAELHAFRAEQSELFKVYALLYLQNDHAKLKTHCHESAKTIAAMSRKTHDSCSTLLTTLHELQRLKAQLLSSQDTSREIHATLSKKQQKLQQVLTHACFHSHTDRESDADFQRLVERINQAQQALNTQQQDVLLVMETAENALFAQFEQFQRELAAVYLGDYYQEQARTKTLELTTAIAAIDEVLMPTFDDFKELSQACDSLQIFVSRGEGVIAEISRKQEELTAHMDVIEDSYPEKESLLTELKKQSRLLATVKKQQLDNREQALIASAKAQEQVDAFMAFTFNDLSLLLTSLQVDDFFAACKRHLSLDYLLTLHDPDFQASSAFQSAQKVAEATDKLTYVDDVLVSLTLLIDQADTHAQPQLQALQEKFQMAAQKLRLIVANDSAAIIDYGQAQSVYFNNVIARDQALLQLKANLRAPSMGFHSVSYTKAFYQEDQRFLSDVYHVLNAAQNHASADLMAPEIATLTFNDQLINRIDQEIRTATSNDLAVIRLERWLQVLAMAKDESNTALWQVLHTGILQAMRSMPQLIAALPDEYALRMEDMPVSAPAVTGQHNLSPAPPISVRQVELQRELFPVNTAIHIKDQPLLSVIKKTLMALDGVEVVAATIDDWFKASVGNIDTAALLRLDQGFDQAAMAGVFEPLATISKQLSAAVYSSVLLTPNPAKRMALLDQWLNVLNELKAEGNDHAIEAILMACHRLEADKLIPFDCQKALASATQDYSKHQYALSAYLAAPLTTASHEPLVNCPSFNSIHQRLKLQGEKLETATAELHALQQRLRQVQAERPTSMNDLPTTLQQACSQKEAELAQLWQPFKRQIDVISQGQQRFKTQRPNALSQTLARLSPDFNEQRQSLLSKQARQLVNADQRADRLAAAPASTFFNDGVLSSYRAAAFSADQRYTAQSALIQNTVLYELILKKQWVFNIDAKVADYEALNRCLLQNPSAAQLKRALEKIVLDPLTKADLQTVLATNQQTYYHSLIENSVLRDCVKGRVLKSTSHSFLQLFSSYGTENKLLALNKATHQVMDTEAFKTLLADVDIYLTPSELTRVLAENALLRATRKLVTQQASIVHKQSAAPATLADVEPSRLARWSEAVKANPVKAAAIGAAACVFFKPALVVGAVLGGIEAFRTQELVVDEQRPHGP